MPREKHCNLDYHINNWSYALLLRGTFSDLHGPLHEYNEVLSSRVKAWKSYGFRFSKRKDDMHTLDVQGYEVSRRLVFAT